jgi:hypothetical protein
MGATALQIKQWKEIHGSINEGELTEVYQDENNEPQERKHKFYFRDLKIQDLAVMDTKSSEVEKVVCAIDNAWLGGDEIIQQNEQMKWAAANYINNQWTLYAVSIKKL